MSCPDLVSFWNRNQESIAGALPRGIHALAHVMQTGADEFDMIQSVEGEYLCWKTQENKLFLMFCIIPDPRNLDRVLDAYVHTKEKQCPLTGILVHQWTDGEGNWDAFIISSQRAMQHGGRYSGSDTVQERGPQLRMDTYTLFDSDCEFPEPGEDLWVELLDGPIDGVITQLEALAQKHDCTQTHKVNLVQWRNPKGKLEVQFFLFPDQKDLTPFIHLYQHLKQEPSPVSFVFVKCEQKHLCDIFRLSARSYLEHHNRPGYTCCEGMDDLDASPVTLNCDGQGKGDVGDIKLYREGSNAWLSGIVGWSSRDKVSSVHAALEMVMRAHGEDFSYDYLVGISSLAFRMQVGGLCPSSPHPGCGYQCDRSLQVVPWKAKGYDIDQHKRKVSQGIFDVIVQSIDSGIPVITGEEDDGLIIGYDKKKKTLTCLHPYRFNGKTPFVIGFNDMRKICWGIGVYTEPRTESIDRQALVTESLQQAVTMAKQERADNYALGFKAWETYIHILETQKKFSHADILGNAWIYECLVQYRQIAAKYLNMIKDQFEETSKKHLENASGLYRQISEDILKGGKDLNEIAPYPKSLKKGEKWTKEMRQEQINRLEEAMPLEVRAIDEIEKALSLIPNHVDDFEINKSEISE